MEVGVVGVSGVVCVVSVVEGLLVVVAWPVVVSGDADVVVSGVVERGTDVELGGADVVVKGAVRVDVEPQQSLHRSVMLRGGIAVDCWVVFAG